jgi:hypothetical protein
VHSTLGNSFQEVFIKGHWQLKCAWKVWHFKEIWKFPSITEKYLSAQDGWISLWMNA